MTTVLIVDDEANMRWVLQRALEKAGYEPVSAANGHEALNAAARQRIDLALLDLKMPGMDGLAVLRELRQRQPDLPVILLTAHATVPTAVEAMRLGALDYLRKPFDVEEVLFKIANALQRQAVQVERDALSARLRQMADPAAGSAAVGLARFIGASPALDEPLARAQAAAGSDYPVLLTGEAGTGKTLLAQLIHDNGRRPDAPLVLTDCGGLSAAALRQELLAENGRWRQALGGTLLLRRIDRLPPELAEPLSVHLAGLLRSPERPAGLRVIATAAAAVAPPLLALLDGIRIDLPALRARAGDLVLLAQHLAPNSKLTGLAFNVLLAYPWPGNVAELAGVLAHARALAGAGPIELEHLPARISAAPAEAASTFRLPPGGIDLDQLERELIRQALEMAQGNKSQAARLLGLTRHTLLYRLEKHGFE
jgi:two-component system, NtrC family, response regulator AtoC